MKSLQKIFCFEPLRKSLLKQHSVILAFVFGSSRDGNLKREDSDIDIAIWLHEPVTIKKRLGLIEICQETLQFDNIDLSILNNSNNVIRFEALSGKRLVIKDWNLYTDLFSKTCRYYEDERFRLELNRKVLIDMRQKKVKTKEK